MALDATKLEKIGGGLRQLFIYNAGADAVATVTGAGYFNNASNQFNQGDVIICLGAALTTVDILFITSATKAAAVTTLGTEGITAT
jgi:hypothetical protein